MSLSIECDGCGHTGRVSPAKAGRQIDCPSCGSAIQVARSTPVRRPKTDTSSAQYIALGGATLLLVGVLAMMWIKKNQLGDDQFFDGVLPSDNASAQNEGDAEEGVQVSDSDSETQNTQQETTVADTDPAPVNGNGPVEVGQLSDNGTFDDGEVILPEISAVAPEMLLLAGMQEVVLQLNGFSADTRGAVENAVSAEVLSELKKCRLSCVETNDRPSFVVNLDLRQDGGVQKLGMKAELLGEVSGVPVSIWKNDAALVPIESKSLTGAVGIPGLDREVARFFTPLRDKLNSARTRIESIRKNKDRREDARRPSGGNRF